MSRRIEMSAEGLIASMDFIRVDGVHPLDWRVNKDGPRSAIVLVSDEEPESLESTDGIAVRKWKGSGGKWHLAFVLDNGSYQKMFDSFCDDLIESSRDTSPEKATGFAARRYEHWMMMFRVNRQFLNEQTIQGLLGELIALEDVMFGRYGEETSLESWMNRKRGNQDFIQADRWYEIKTILDGRHELKITSFEQLDRDDDGHIIVVTLRRSNRVSTKHITLNSMYHEILGKLAEPRAEKILSDTIAFVGFEEDPYYDDICFEKVRIVEYDVREGFPRIRRSRLHVPGVINGTYDIDLDSLEEYEVMRWS